MFCKWATVTEGAELSEGSIGLVDHQATLSSWITLQEQGGTSTLPRGTERKCVVCICYLLCVSGVSYMPSAVKDLLQHEWNSVWCVCTMHSTCFHCCLLIYGILGVPQNWPPALFAHLALLINTRTKLIHTLLLNCSILATKCWRTCMWLHMFLVCLVWSLHVFLQLV